MNVLHLGPLSRTINMLADGNREAIAVYVTGSFQAGRIVASLDRNITIHFEQYSPRLGNGLG